MFNYTKETILNDLAKVFVGTNAFGIKRAGNYDLSKVVGLKIFKTKGVQGSVASLKLKMATALVKGATYRFTMFVSTPNKELADFAYPNWGEFGKVVLAEFTGKGDAAEDAAALVNALKLALQPDNELYKVALDGTDGLVITLAESWMKLAEYAFEAYNEIEDKYIPAADLTQVAKVENVEDFATAKWIVENLRYPSYPNIRFAPLYADEAPIAGKVYNQYAFEYCVKRSTPGGLSGVGQVVDSITTHVIYVPADLCADNLTTAGTFEKLLQDATAGTSTIAAGEHTNEFVITLAVAPDATA